MFLFLRIYNIIYFISIEYNKANEINNKTKYIFYNKKFILSNHILFNHINNIKI